MRGKLWLGNRVLFWKLGNVKRSFVVRDEQHRELGNFTVNVWNTKLTVNFNDELVSTREKGLISLIGMYLMAIMGYK